MAAITIAYNRANANTLKATVAVGAQTADFVLSFDDALSNRITRKDILLALEAMEKAAKESRVFQAT